MKGFGNVFGWLLLGIALAVPAFMFWNWFQRLRAGAPGVSAPPSAASMSKLFNSDGPQAEGPVNPMRHTALASGATALAAADTVTSTTAAPANLQPKLLAEAPRVGPDTAVPSVSPGPAASPGPAVSAAPPAKKDLLQVSTAAAAGVPPARPAAGPGAVKAPPGKGPGRGIRFEPKSVRDPMVSPLEIKELKRMEEEVRLAKEAEEKRRLEEEEARRHRPKRKAVVRAEPNIEDQLDLQGIIAVAGVRYALLNGEKYKVGDEVEDAKITAITANAVSFEYNGRQFKKFMR